MTKNDQILLDAYNKGYRIINNEVYNPKGKLVKKFLTKQGYYRFSNKGQRVFVHRLVAYQKYGNIIFDKNNMCRHLDNNKLNNFEINIIIGSAKDNSMDRPKEMRHKMAVYAASKNRIFSDKLIKKIRLDRKNGFTYKKLINKYKVGKSTLSYIFNKASY